MKQAIRECSGAIIKALAAIVNCPRTDKQLDADVIPRDPVMAHVMAIRDAMDRLSAAAQAETAQAAPAATGLLHDEDALHSIERAADLLEGYAEFIKSDVMAADIERHPYLPEVEGVAEELRELAAQAAPVVPAGYALVPLEPTEAMLDAGAAQVYEPTNRNDCVHVWSVMVEAATPGATHGN